MSFGVSDNVRKGVRVCTPDLFHRALDNPEVARTCAEIEDALEACRRGEITKEDYETRKAELKKKLMVFAFTNHTLNSWRINHIFNSSNTTTTKTW